MERAPWAPAAAPPISAEMRRRLLLEKRLTGPLNDSAAGAEHGNSFDGFEQDVDGGFSARLQSVAKRARAGGQALGDSSCEPASAFAAALGSAPAGAAEAQLAALSRNKELAEHRAKVSGLQDELSKAQQQSSARGEHCLQLVRELEELRRAQGEREERSSEALVQLSKGTAELESNERRRRVALDSSRLGACTVQRVGAVLQEAWEDGPAFRDLADRQRELLRLREGIEAQRKLLKRRIAPPGAAADSSPSEFVKQDAYVVAEECFKVRLALLKKEDDQLDKERDRLEQEKARHLREVKRIRDEDASRFRNCTLLGGRYVLQFLLGRGGFSEVYKAYDTHEMRYVACKIHQLVPQWSEERKRNYVRHAAREYSILKRMAHDSIVRLFDVFEIDNDSFCTVLEVCEGHDLDVHLKIHGTLSEREARVITAQIFSGLVYLASGQRRVIHFDLKPGNILFDALGRVKITDFGLSKVMEENAGSEGMELTSQGAGTYWYLPPECFETGSTPKISSKVDVWSAGIIFFQMLYGRRPFGHDQTQEKILREETILRSSRTIDFPDKPAVCAEAKAFIRRCLTYSQADRPDVQEAAADAYLSFGIGR